MRVLVTGGFGNVGSHVVRELHGRGHTVRVLELDTRATRRVARTMPAAIEAAWGDIRSRESVDAALADVDVVLHLAAVIPPGSDKDPTLARSSNVDGTATVVAAAQAAPRPPRLLFTSTLDVHGYTQDQAPPRHVTDPMVATDPYSGHKIEAEGIVRSSTLDWCIVRLADVPILGLRSPDPIMYEIGAHNRIEAVHPLDVAVALANALTEPRLWGTVHFIGGGPACQVVYRDYINKILAAMGIGALPDRVFRPVDYVTDWLDTAESEALLHYQRHSFDDIVASIAANVGWRRHAIAAVGPIARLFLVQRSPYRRPRAPLS